MQHLPARYTWPQPLRRGRSWHVCGVGQAPCWVLSGWCLPARLLLAPCKSRTPCPHSHPCNFHTSYGNGLMEIHVLHWYTSMLECHNCTLSSLILFSIGNFFYLILFLFFRCIFKVTTLTKETCFFCLIDARKSNNYYPLSITQSFV